MDAPTEWTYGGLVDWTSIDTFKLTQTEYALRSIIEAIKERFFIAKYFAGTALTYNLRECLTETFNPCGL